MAKCQKYISAPLHLAYFLYLIFRGWIMNISLTPKLLSIPTTAGRWSPPSLVIQQSTHPSASYNRRKIFNLYQQTITAQPTKNIKAKINKRKEYFTSHPKTKWQKTSSNKLIHQRINQIIPIFQQQICSALKERFFVCFATCFSRFESYGKKMPLTFFRFDSAENVNKRLWLFFQKIRSIKEEKGGIGRGAEEEKGGQGGDRMNQQLPDTSAA